MDNPFERFIQNEHWKVPVMFGHTSSEFFSVPKAETLKELKKMAVDMFGDDAGAYMELCEARCTDIEERKKRASVSSSEYAIRVATQANADMVANTPMYYYVFDVEIPGWDNPGTFHSVDLWFFFETLAKCWRPFVGKHYDLARQMCNYWAYFIRSGDPNGHDSTGEELPRWEAYSLTAPYGMLFADRSEFSREEPSELMRFLVQQYFKKNWKRVHAE
ncbi:carboxylesterase family protein [Cohnella endophytica]|uniref:carboxylesterase family protein n=1 Tax=Cohnella endophytica TaxID=2419778 RepID=UPI001F2C2B44|nr:carboxylesterase family protein [Cohnella endophytica]